MPGQTQRASDTAVVFRFGEFIFRCEPRQLLHKGVERRLSPKAQELLRILLLAWPNPQSRESLYDALWPSTFVCETNMAGVVSELRRALGDDARAAQYIRTVHGYGYAFCGEVTSGRAPVAAVSLICEGQRFGLRVGRNFVGRAQDCHVVLADRTVSRRHASITIEDDRVRLEDLESKNGTYVDGSPIRSCEVTTKSKIVFGAAVASLLLPKFSSTQSIRVNIAEIERNREANTSV